MRIIQPTYGKNKANQKLKQDLRPFSHEARKWIGPVLQQMESPRGSRE